MRTNCDNELLGGLPGDERRRLAAHLQRVLLHEHELLCGEGRPVAHVYFPTSALLSIVCSAGTGDSMDVAVIGRDGVAGLTFSAAGLWSPGIVVVQRSGEAWRLPLCALHQEFARGGMLQMLALRYQQLMMAQMAQTAMCNRLHRVDQQLCRWILGRVDRCGNERVDATREQVARRLGVRREAVSAAAGRLQAEGALDWGRGHLRLLDRAAVEAHCCECHATLRREAQALFPLMRRAA